MSISRHKMGMRTKSDGTTYSSKGYNTRYKKTMYKNPSTQQLVRREVAKELSKRSDYKQLKGRWSPSLGFSATGVVLGLSTVLSRGDDAVNQFSGQCIFPKNLKVRVNWYGTSSDAHNVVRFMVVQWFDDAIPSNAGFVLDNTDIGTVYAPLAQRLWTNKPLVKILFDHRDILQTQNGAPGNHSQYQTFDVYIPGMKLQRMVYNSTTTRCQKGEIYLVAVSDSTALNHPGIDASFEMVFTD